VIVHSYIGQQPVYSEVLRCHIYPTSDYKPPKFKPKVIVEQVIDRSEYSMTVHLLYKYLRKRKPSTASQISKEFGYTARHIRQVLRCNPNVFRVVREEMPALFTVVDNPVITKKSVCFRIYEYMLVHGWATISGLSRVLDVKLSTISESIRHHGELFVRDGKYGKEKVWRLKEAA
jgi:DNA-directed RNA polymerase subunit F